MDFMQTIILLVILICGLILIFTSNLFYGIIFIIAAVIIKEIFKTYNSAKEQEIRNEIYKELKNKSKD